LIGTFCKPTKIASFEAADGFDWMFVHVAETIGGNLCAAKILNVNG
jgi:hypothetical protein